MRTSDWIVMIVIVGFLVSMIWMTEKTMPGVKKVDYPGYRETDLGLMVNNRFMPLVIREDTLDEFTEDDLKPFDPKIILKDLNGSKE